MTSSTERKCGHPDTPENTTRLTGRCRACLVVGHRGRGKTHPRVQRADGRCLVCINSAARRANHALYGWKRQGHEPSFTWERYQAMLSKQGGRCAICRQRPEDCQTQGRKRLDADHDHVTGKVRGLLCNPCNGAVALFEKGTLRRPDLIERVRDYLGLDREQAA